MTNHFRSKTTKQSFWHNFYSYSDMKREHIYHLYRRAGFGIRPEEVDALQHLTLDAVVDDLLMASENPTPLELDLTIYDRYFEENPEPKYPEFRQFVKSCNHLLRTFNSEWVQRICDPTEALNERMTLFWANIFSCEDETVSYIQTFNNVVRKNALGDFKGLTKAVSREPAMIRYLDISKNSKKMPNENFARELMELFMLGEGHYTEGDIKEAARAFTGYAYHLDGRFRIREGARDTADKNFFGFKGPMDGDTVIDIIAQQEQCARFICTKMYRYFVNEKPQEEHISEMVSVFYPSYMIKDVMRFMLKAPWFYESTNIGTKIKSPIDLFASIYKMVPYKIVEDNDGIYIQELLGQVLLRPPNVAGWQGGKNWIDTNTMLLRLKLPSVLLGGGYVPFSEGRFDAIRKPFADHIKVRVGWQQFQEAYEGADDALMIEALFATKLIENTRKMIANLEAISEAERCLQLMSIPEFQLT